MGLTSPPAGSLRRIATGWPYRPELFAEKYASLFDGGDAWNDLLRAPGALFPWRRDSTYVRRPPYF